MEDMNARNTVNRSNFRRSSRRPGTCSRFGLLAVCLAGLALSSCDTFDFYGLLSGTGAHGPTGGPLSISPLSVTVMINATCTFTATGGTPPYRFTVSGSGTIDEGTGVYKAPPAPSFDTIHVSDAAGGPPADATATSVVP
jgi:hypothetical protein